MEALPFPFLAIVGQREMKLALLLGLINPSVGGILLVGPRGTAKTTAVRSLLDLLPKVERSLCYYGCLPEDIEAGGIDAVCPDCAKKYAEGQPLVAPDRVRLVELPLNSRLEDVVGGIDSHTPATGDQSASTSASASGAASWPRPTATCSTSTRSTCWQTTLSMPSWMPPPRAAYTVRRGSLSATYRARFVLIGSMNPEEGRLRPQILDRFGLRVVVHGLDDPAERLEAYRRVQAYLANPRAMTSAYGEEMLAATQEIQISPCQPAQSHPARQGCQPAIQLVQKMGIDSLRAEITWFEAARAYAAADGRNKVTPEDLQAVAPMALRLRRSQFMHEYFSSQAGEEEEMQALLGGLGKKRSGSRAAE